MDAGEPLCRYTPYIYGCRYISMYTYIWMPVYIHIHTYIDAGIYPYTHIYVDAGIYPYTHIYGCRYISIYIYTYGCRYITIYIWMPVSPPHAPYVRYTRYDTRYPVDAAISRSTSSLLLYLAANHAMVWCETRIWSDAMVSCGRGRSPSRDTGPV